MYEEQKTENTNPVIGRVKTKLMPLFSGITSTTKKYDLIFFDVNNQQWTKVDPMDIINIGSTYRWFDAGMIFMFAGENPTGSSPKDVYVFDGVELDINEIFKIWDVDESEAKFNERALGMVSGISVVKTI